MKWSFGTIKYTIIVLKPPVQWVEYIIVYNTFHYIFVDSKEDFFHFGQVRFFSSLFAFKKI